ncbi:MAG TPA: type II toxin-antitoxin system PemK/MazF family toxin [Pyrinomonadaceae bacterium]|nr:type II toxin-antitoxin system PemK/MazF family toxin [Pyrinomonadaceae bacterium]
MKRGDVYPANLEPRSGSEQRGRRPVVVISHDALNQIKNWRSIIVIPLSTSPFQAKRSLTIVPISQGVANLSKESVALCHQVTTLDRSKFEQYIGSLPSKVMRKIEEGLKAAMDLF